MIVFRRIVPVYGLLDPGECCYHFYIAPILKGYMIMYLRIPKVLKMLIYTVVLITLQRDRGFFEPLPAPVGHIVTSGCLSI